MATRRKIKFSLKYKIAILIFLLIIITMSIVFIYSINTNIDAQRREIKKSAKQVSDTLSALRLVTSFKSKDVNWTIYEKYMEILNRLDNNILLMAIKDETGEIKASSLNIEILKKDFKHIKLEEDQKKLVKKLVEQKIPHVLRIKADLKIKGEQLSQIIIKFSKKNYEKKMFITTLNMIILTMILLIIGFFSSWYLAKFITNNFNIIAAGMRKVAEGNLDVSVTVKSNDEVGVLADDFNRMIVELKEKVRIKDAFDTVAEGLKEMDDLKKAYKILTYQEMTDKITKGYTPSLKGEEFKTIFVFIDTSSFSQFSFNLLSEEMKELIEKFTEKISLTALEYQGAVLKITDNYILLSFGYPFIHQDDMKRALISTIEIRKELVQAVKSKLTLGYKIEDFYVNFILVNGVIIKKFIEKRTMSLYNSIIDYLNFASKYGAKKQYSTDVYTIKEIVDGTQNLANYEKIDVVTLSDGASTELFKLKGVKF